MKIKIIFAFFMLFSILMCSCVEKPKTLEKDNKNSNIEYSEEASKDSGSLETIRSQLENDMAKKYKNITIKRARVGTAQDMPTYDIAIGMKESFNFRNFISFLYGDKFDISDESLYKFQKKGDKIDPKLPAYEEPTIDEKSGSIINSNIMEYDLRAFKPSEKDRTLSCYSYSFGNLWGSATGCKDPDTYYDFSEYKNQIEHRYDFDYDTVPEDLSYKMSDGQEWGVLEAKNFVENCWNTYFSQNDPMEFTYAVKTIWIMKTASDKFGYLFELQRQDAFGNYYETDDSYVRDDAAIEAGKPFKIDNAMNTWCAGKDTITYFHKSYTFKHAQASNDGKELISLRKASDILSEAVAPNINLELTAELNYVTICKGYPYFQLWKNPLYYWDTCLNRCEFEIKPYWCFRPEQSTLLDRNSSEIYFINAITGELEIMKAGR